MAVFNKQKIQVAVDKHSKLDVSGTHITTSKFMEFQPVFYRHMIAGEHLRGNISALSRLAPVAVPSYGRCRLNLRSFFIPFEFVMPNFNSMLVDSIGVSYNEGGSLVAESPKIKSSEILNMFLLYKYVGVYDLAVIVTPPAAYDFYYNGNYYAFTSYGRSFYKILLSLGYQILVGTAKADEMYFSVLPILCMLKVYVDWYRNLAYDGTSRLIQMKRYLTFNDPTSVLTLTYSDLGDILSFCWLVTYDCGRDVYTNAWDNPVAPNTGVFSSRTMYDTSIPSGGVIGQSSANAVTMGANGTPRMVASSLNNIGSDYIHEVLKSLTDYMKRNQLSGSQSVQRFLSRYGILLDNKEIRRSYYLGSQSIDIDFGSVMQTADTSAPGDPSNLGDYSGVGFGKGSLNVDFKCDDFGLFLVIASIVPAADLVQGFDRNLLHIGKDSFFIPEFDNLGCSAIAKGEVYCSRSEAFITDTWEYQEIFGFAPRYYEYKQGRSMVSGDFVCDSAMIGGSAWHLNRLFVDTQFIGGISGLVHGEAFTYGTDKNQYDRIFQYTNEDIDKFYLVFHASLQTLAPCKSLFDTYDFDSFGKVIEQNGNSAAVN